MSELPPDPLTQTRSRLAEVAADTARDLAARELRRTLKGYVPRILWPLIPGEGGSVEGNVKKAASRWLWGAVGSAVISLLFLGFFTLAFLGFVGVTALAVVSSM